MMEALKPESLPTGSQTCDCSHKRHHAKLVVLTGGPGGGKTAILEMARRYFCHHVVLLPEAASIVFGGGFPRLDTPAGRRAAQRTIYRVQLEMEGLAARDPNVAMVLCDRGAIDGLAYWPGERQRFFEEFGGSLEQEMARYAAVIHIAVPDSAAQYHRTGIRHESLLQAHQIDSRIRRIWRGHPRRIVVGAEADFVDKAARAIQAMRNEVPLCCRHANAHAGMKPN
jgi:predicted ATPase